MCRKKKIANSEEQKSVTYNSSIAILKLVLIGIAVLIGCVIAGILITQLIGWIVEGAIASISKEPSQNLHFGDFLGGAIGLTVGFVLDKICIDRINSVYAFRRFMSALDHELANIQCKEDGKSHIYIERKEKKEEVVFSASGKVETENLLKCTGVFNFVKELM